MFAGRPPFAFLRWFHDLVCCTAVYYHIVRAYVRVIQPGVCQRERVLSVGVCPCVNFRDYSFTAQNAAEA